jgi:predicted PurR-regulated permease PerM
MLFLFVMDKEPEKIIKKEISYTVRVWQTTAIVCLTLIIILIVRVVFSVLLMAMAGALIAVYFHGLADLIMRKTKLKKRASLAVSIAATTIILVGLTWIIGAKIQRQVVELSSSLPQTIHAARSKMAVTPIGEKILQYTSGNNSQKMIDTATNFFNTSFGVLGDLYIIIFLSIFFTSDPTLYRQGILFLFPPEKKKTGKIIISRISTSLKGWLKSILISMVLITILIWISLSFLGMPATMVLGMITGLLEVIPNFGPIIAMIPGVLLAFTISTKIAILVALIYIAAQTIVASIVTPLLQKKIINLPPALTLISQLIMGTLSGVMGIILAVPLLSIIIILVDELYIRRHATDS